MKLEFSRHIFGGGEQFKYQIPVGAELFHTDRATDGQTDMMNPIVAFRNFANAPKNECCGCVLQLTAEHS